VDSHCENKLISVTGITWEVGWKSYRSFFVTYYTIIVKSNKELSIYIFLIPILIYGRNNKKIEKCPVLLNK
jgi:hypothetical protein